MRDHDKQDGLFPVDDEDRYRVIKSQQNVLRGGKIKPGPIAEPQLSQIRCDGLLLELTTVRRVTEERENIVLLADPVCDRVIARFVVEMMMILVVSRNPAKRRKTVEQRQPVVGEYI